MNVLGIVFMIALCAFAVFEVVSLVLTVRKKRKAKQEQTATNNIENTTEDKSIKEGMSDEWYNDNAGDCENSR